jgi:hypothetical protein
MSYMPERKLDLDPRLETPLLCGPRGMVGGWIKSLGGEVCVDVFGVLEKLGGRVT